MEAKWLEDFLSVARTGNFSQSANERHITQSAFSRRIKALEQWVGVPLIDRSTYPTRLTPSGDQFLAVAREAITSLLKTRQDLRQARNVDCKSLRIVIQHSLAGDFLAKWVVTLNLDRDTLVRLKADNLHDCVREFEEGNADLLICYAHAQLPLGLDAARFLSVVIDKDLLVAVVRPDPTGQPLHMLTPESSVPIPWLAYSNEAFLGRAASLAFGDGAAPSILQIVFESALAEGLRAAAVSGLGIAWLPSNLVETDLKAGRLVRASHPCFDVPMEVRLFVDPSLLENHQSNIWAAISESLKKVTNSGVNNYDLNA